MYKTWILAVFVLISVSASAQQLAPPVLELSVKRNIGRGAVLLGNNAVIPQTVTLEAVGFTVSEMGGASSQPLDPSITVNFSETSFRMPPKSQHQIDYDVICPKVPCHVQIQANFHGLRTTNGIAVVIRLISFVYLVQREALRVEDVQIQKEIQGLVITNRSEKYGRVEATLRYVDGTERVEGFPLFPGAVRKLTFEKPGYGILKFPKGSFDSRKQ